MSVDLDFYRRFAQEMFTAGFESAKDLLKPDEGQFTEFVHGTVERKAIEQWRLRDALQEADAVAKEYA